MIAIAIGPNAPPPPQWIVASGSLYSMLSSDAATTRHFFNTPDGYCTGASLVASPVPAGLAATPVLAYTSYAQFSTDVGSGSITYPYKWVMYDGENWAQTPTAEKNDPVTAMNSFGALAHSHGYKVMHAPGRDLADVTTTVYPKLPGETDDQWYVRVLAPAAGSCEVLVVQNEGNTGNIPEYQWLLGHATTAAITANPSVKVFSEVSTSNGTSSQMVTAATSAPCSGLYVAMPGAVPAGLAFFQAIAAAGF